ncbi:hypothetical protein ISCGN_004454 [Ixodes scapularis]
MDKEIHVDPDLVALANASPITPDSRWGTLVSRVELQVAQLPEGHCQKVIHKLAEENTADAGNPKDWDSYLLNSDGILLEYIPQGDDGSSVPPFRTVILRKLCLRGCKFAKISRTTLWRALVDLGFTFIKRNRDSLLMERTDLVLWRSTYLRAIRKHGLDDRTIYYLDETWVNAGRTRSKAEFLGLVERTRLTMPGLQKYRIDDIPEQHGHSVLRLPPYHCELNHIELVWSQVKGSIAGANKTFKLVEVELPTPGALQQVTPDDWKACARHVIDVENKMWEADCLPDTVIDSVVIHLGSDHDKSSDEGMDDSNDGDIGCESLLW